MAQHDAVAPAFPTGRVFPPAKRPAWSKGQHVINPQLRHGEGSSVCGGGREQQRGQRARGLVRYCACAAAAAAASGAAVACGAVQNMQPTTATASHERRYHRSPRCQTGIQTHWCTTAAAAAGKTQRAVGCRSMPPGPGPGPPSSDRHLWATAQPPLPSAQRFWAAHTPPRGTSPLCTPRRPGTQLSPPNPRVRRGPRPGRSTGRPQARRGRRGL